MGTDAQAALPDERLVDLRHVLAEAATVDLDAMPPGWCGGLPLLHIGPTVAIVLWDIEPFGVHVPAGYITDGASVPRAFYNILARFTDALGAALAHDARYDPPAGPDGVKRRQKTRKQADLEFLHNLKASGVNLARRQAAYRAVRLFGFRPWNAGTKKGIQNP